MPDLSMLLHNLPDFGAWWRALQTFAGDNLPWVLVGLVAIGWILHVLLLKSLLKIVFGAIGYGIKSILYWVTHVFWAVLKWLGRLFGRGAKASGRGVKAVGRRGKTSFKHHPWWGIGILIVGAMLAHAYAPNYSERGAVNTTLQSLLILYIIVAAFILMLRRGFNRRRTGHRG